jgi:hypothetical protein
MNLRTVSPLMLLASLLAAGCDDPGRPLAELRGTVVNQLSVAPDAVTATLVWANSQNSPDTYVTTSVDVAGSYPAKFEMQLFAPPPDAALNDYTGGGAFPDESRIGIAYVTALKPGADTANLDEADVEGLSEVHLVAYVEKDIQPGTFSETLVGGPLQAGYHLLRATPRSAAELQVVEDCQAVAETEDEYAACGGVFDRLSAEPGGFGAGVEIHLGDDVRAPNWT